MAEGRESDSSGAADTLIDLLGKFVGQARGKWSDANPEFIARHQDPIKEIISINLGRLTIEHGGQTMYIEGFEIRPHVPHTIMVMTEDPTSPRAFTVPLSGWSDRIDTIEYVGDE